MISTSAATKGWESAGGLFRAIGSPLRVGIISLLGEEPRSVNALVEALGAPQPVVSQHLKVLRDHCLVTADRRGRESTYRLMDSHVRHIVDDAIRHVSEHNPKDPVEQHQTTQEA